jgi:hypothetical protein
MTTTVDAAAPIGDAQGPSNLTNACHDLAASACRWDQRCTPGALAYRDGATAHCEEAVFKLCSEDVALPGSLKTAEQLTACARANDVASCDQPADSYAEVCQATAGTLANGARCAWGSQCAGRACLTFSGAYCGICSQLKGQNELCQDTSECIGATKCRDGHCILTANGATCDDTHACSPPLTCQAGHCSRALQADATCQTDPDFCDRDRGFACNGKTLRCSPIQFVTQGICGEAPSGSLVDCAWPTACSIAANAAQGTCVPPLPDGAPCSLTSGAWCTSLCIANGPSGDQGTCRNIPPASCN